MKYIGLGRERYRAYCQTCGKDITNEGGDVGQGRIYCHGYKNDGLKCLEQDLIRLLKENEGEVFIFNYHNPRQVQKAIKKGRIMKFGQLENIASK